MLIYNNSNTYYDCKLYENNKVLYENVKSNDLLATVERQKA